ncbi:MAG: RusA family crossover junction endodeoxyribonuclease [Lachnospiraceae bacterium]
MGSVTFHVPGKPQGKARARTYYNANAGKHVSSTPDKTVLYENFIKDRFLQKANGFYLESGVPATLRIVARFLPPKSKPKKVKQQMLDGEILPLKKPDMDNIVKVVADALNGVAYHDDTQVALVIAKKAYSAVEGLDITVEEYKDGK